MDMDQQHHLRFLRTLHPKHALYLRKLSDLYRGDPLRCSRCRGDIHHGSEYYCCEEEDCRVFVHKHPCAEVPPPLIQHHPSHPQHPLTLHMSEEAYYCCSLCKEENDEDDRDWFYLCESCSDFNLHATCVLLTLPDNEGKADGATLQHKEHIHEHPLSSLFVKLKGRFFCKRCECSIFGESYVCYACGIFFHKACIDAPREIQHHPFHPQHTLELISDDSELRYSCGECDDVGFRPSTLISTLPHKEEVDDLREEEKSRSAINHFAHEHPLNPFNATMEINNWCKACGALIVNGFYGCIDCDFLIHESCAKLPSEIQHYLHTSHPLSLVNQLEVNSLNCESCKGWPCGGFAYYCETCHVALHVECARETTPVYLEEEVPTSENHLHEHNLFYVATYRGNSLCKICGKQCYVDLYHCWECEISVHYDCVHYNSVHLLSKTMKSKFHVDILTLHESMIEDNSDENCCDICEGNRDPELWVYICAGCQFFAHVKCAVSPVRLKPKKENPELAPYDKEIGNVKQEWDLKQEWDDLRKDLWKKEASLRTKVADLEALNTRLADVLYVGVMHSPRLLYCRGDHALYLRELSQHYYGDPLQCGHCGGDIQRGSVCYCCERCDFYVHKHPCAEPPPLIPHHPCHPQHPLTLHMSKGDPCCVLCKEKFQEYEDWFYQCESCSDFNLHAECAVATLPKNEGKVDATMLQQNKHTHDEHPLSSLVVKLKGRFRCRGCTELIFGEANVCYECGIFFHKVCSDAPQEIQHHPFHPQHTLELILYDSKLRYSCRECDYKCSNISTLISTLPYKEKGDVSDEEESWFAIDHFAHEHRLNPFHAAMETKYQCKLCSEPIVNGFYGCIDCHFLIHESCAKLPFEIRHYLHTKHPLSLVARYPESCESCKSSCFWSINYYCETCHVGLDVECARETLIYLEKGAPVTIQHFSHEHELTLHHLREGDDYPLLYSSTNKACYWCAQVIKGPGYGCRMKGCDFFIHKSCLDLPPNVQQSSHSHLLTPHHDESDNWPPCIAFERKYNNFMFSCAEGKLNLDVACAKLERHNLFYVANNWMKPPCKVCGKPCGVDFFHCWECRVSLHYDCARVLPRIIVSNFHVDPLTLYEYVEDDYDEDEYYCDICEGRRDPELWVYHCAECKFFAHVTCATSPVRLNFEKEKVESRQLEEKIGCIQPQVVAMKAAVEEMKKSLKAREEKKATLQARREKSVSQS